MKKSSVFFASGGTALVVGCILMAYGLWWIAIPLVAVVAIAGTVELIRKKRKRR
jgi:predicted branched-subunit amino acid permease